MTVLARAGSNYDHKGLGWKHIQFPEYYGFWILRMLDNGQSPDTQ
jgi:hypothetical protein